MQYFKISYSTDPKVIGATFPQSQKAIHPVNVDALTHLWNHLIGMSFTNAILPELVIHKNAKLTDLISSSATGARLVVSQKLKDLLASTIDIDVIESRPIKVWNKEKIEPYWIFNPIVFQVDLIDFKHSRIWLLKSGIELEQKFFSDAKDFLNTLENTQYPEQILIKELAIRESPQKDLFVLNYLTDGLGYFVSESLKAEIQNAGCTGIEFT